MSLLNHKDALNMTLKDKLIKQENQAICQTILKLTIENEFVRNYTS